LTFSLSARETLVILGESGTGKSTILHLILGLIKPQEGKVTVFGEDLLPLQERALYPLRKRIGMVFQHGALFDSLTVEENLAFRLRNDPDHREDKVLKEVEEKLQFVGLWEFRKRYPRELSGGQKKRVAIARALVGNPELLLYDEPTTGLDPLTAGRIIEVMERVKEIYGTPSIVVTHELPYAYRLADRVLLLREGAVHFSGGVEEFRSSRDNYIVHYRSWI